MIDLETLVQHASSDVAAEPSLGANVRGVYAMFFDAHERVLEKSGYLEYDHRRPLRIAGHDLLYVGASLDPLRRRILTHLTGNTKGSTLRMTVGGIMSEDLNLEPISSERHSYFDFGEGEYRLTDWLLRHTRIAFIHADDPFRLEMDLIQQAPLPLNISHRKRHGFSKYLLAMRAYYAARPVQGRATSRATA